MTDHHVTRRGQRPRVILFAIACVLVGLGLLVGLAAPVELVALLGAGVVGLVVGLVITLFWKISFHVAAAAGAVVVLARRFGSWVLVLGALVPLIAWSRVELRHHTPAQVVAGGIVGAATAAVSFTLLLQVLR